MSSGLRHLVGTIDNCRSWDILEYIDSSWTVSADCKDLSLSHERARYIHQLLVWMRLLVFQPGHVHVPF